MKPSVGRVLWYYEDRSATPLAATVAYVHGDGKVNIGYLDEKGVASNREKVPLVQEGEPLPEVPFCRWPTIVKTPIQEAAEKGFKS
jgi:hypothetical protein